ncbi:hypothetical protein CesoFtcFv8_005555 [Champsocephalus esox]|uniref:Uncharacterized protein n=1 Tax=Champsocephalus esox TaxID=159716 RepID=A0AAN8CPV7_9TELE|nr:hypothetical protein CesoFtcFv8_005555 [Champsocephalus esox]
MNYPFFFPSFNRGERPFLVASSVVHEPPSRSGSCSMRLTSSVVRRQQVEVGFRAHHTCPVHLDTPQRDGSVWDYRG